MGPWSPPCICAGLALDLSQLPHPNDGLVTALCSSDVGRFPNPGDVRGGGASHTTPPALLHALSLPL